MKTLYLDTSTPYTVILDGSALRVRGSGSADRLYPLQRLARVVDSGANQWDTQALLACLDAGITLTFLHQDGHLRGQCFGARIRELGLGDRLRDLIAQPEWEDSYRIWQQAAEQVVILDLLATLPVDKASFGSKRLRQAITDAAIRYAGKPLLEKIDQLFASLIRSQVAEQVEQAGLARHLSFFQHKGLDLLSDLTQIVLWEIEMEKLRCLQRYHHRCRFLTPGMFPRLRYPLIKVYERQGPQIERRIRQVIDSLHGWLVERG